MRYFRRKNLCYIIKVGINFISSWLIKYAGSHKHYFYVMTTRSFFLTWIKVEYGLILFHYLYKSEYIWIVSRIKKSNWTDHLFRKKKVKFLHWDLIEFTRRQFISILPINSSFIDFLSSYTEKKNFAFFIIYLFVFVVEWKDWHETYRHF